MTYKKIKKQNGETFAQTLRNHHNGLLEIPDIDIILRYAGRDAVPLLPYLMHLLAANDDNAAVPAKPANPFDLLDQAGYDAFYADTLEKQNSIKNHFTSGELLCTFNDNARYQNHHIVHAVKKDVAQIKRADFTGKEQRQDAYGTSVISIQMHKKGGFISIKNRYNHSVSGCDHTFNSNPDNIIQGLSASLKDHFNVDFSNTSTIPDGYILVNKQVLKYYRESNNIYYGDNFWVTDNTVHSVNKAAGDAMFDGFWFDNKTKTLNKIDPSSDDSFANDFNRNYGGNEALTIRSGNLMRDGKVIIGAENARIKTLHLPELKTMGKNCLSSADALTHFDAPQLVTIAERCLFYTKALTHFDAPQLVTMGERCLFYVKALTHFEAPKLITMGKDCLYYAEALTHFEAPQLTSIDAHIRSYIQKNCPAPCAQHPVIKAGRPCLN